MKNVYLTGRTGGVGKEIFHRLTAEGYKILPLKSRLEDTDSLTQEVNTYLKEHPCDVLINCAGYGRFQPHEEIPVDEIIRMIAVNLTAPLLLSRLCLRSLKERKGCIVNISSVEATRHSRFSALYTATKSGLRHFSLALFEEVRRSGVRVVSLNPGMIRTGFFDNLNFSPSDGDDYALNPKDVAEKISWILSSNGTITDLTLLPQKEGVEKHKR